MSKDWKNFEEAVAQFVQALDPTAQVTHNYKERDRQSGALRQRDVWIETTACKMFPLSILVSCKRLRRKIDQSHIDTFYGELNSSRANIGVLYSYSGFTVPAISKARELGIHCCHLFQNEAPEIPKVLTLEAYHCRSSISLSVDHERLAGWGIENWGDLFNVQCPSEETNIAVVDLISRLYIEAEKSSVEATKWGVEVPQPFNVGIEITSETRSLDSVRIFAHGKWDFYRARLEAYLLNGSYSFTAEKFVGEIAMPAVDRLSPEPGPGWEAIEAPPAMKPGSVWTVFYESHVKESLLESLSEKTITHNEKPELPEG